MREKDKLVKIYDIDPYNLDIIKDTLELMALKGWMLEDISRSRLTFRQYQPQPLRYAVTLLGAEDIYPPINKDKVYSGDQEDSDWHYVANHGKLYVFCNTDEYVAEMVTDPKTKLSYINTVFWQGSFSLLWWPSYMLFLIFILIKIGLGIYADVLVLSCFDWHL